MTCWDSRRDLAVRAWGWGHVRAATALLAGLVVTWLGAAWSGSSVACARGWQHVATQVGPAPVISGLVAEDLDGDGSTELVLVGRDYEGQQDHLYVVGWSGDSQRPLRELASDLLVVDPMSDVALAVGPLTRIDGPEVFVATNDRLAIWRFQEGRLERVWEGRHSTWVQFAAAVRFPDRPAAVVLSCVRTQPRWHILLQAWQWDGQSLQPVAEPFPVGPVRAMTSADLTGDGQGELVLEVGQGSRPGQIEVWWWQDGAFATAHSAPLRDAPVFALGAGRIAEVSTAFDVLLTADNKGRVASYRWDADDGFSREGDVLTLRWGLSWAALGDLDGDGRTEAVVVEYPNLLHVLRWQP